MSTNLKHLIKHPVIRTIGQVAADMGRPCYVVGGFVRDAIMHRPVKHDFDFVTVGSGIELATAVAEALGRKKSLTIYRAYGTAQIRHCGIDLEFVGARKESYNRNSRNPIVEDGTLTDDLSRRDFTVNAMAISITPDSFGELIDLFGGVDDICDKIIRTPLDPNITFSDDPLRMLRAIRFATTLQFDIFPDTFQAIADNADRIEIIVPDRIKDELQKIMAAPKPSIGWDLLLRSGLLKKILPELAAMKGVEVVKGHGHKDNFQHTLEVLDNVAAASDNIWLRWAALLHDIAKPVTKRWDDAQGWTFHNHNFIGGKMVPHIFARLHLPMGSEMNFVKTMVELHMRPIALVEDEVTDSAVRRLVNYAGENLQDLMILARADITSKNIAKKQRFLDNFNIVEQKFSDIIAKDEIRAFRPAINGNEVMQLFGLAPSRTVGDIMNAVTEAARDCEIDNTPEACRQFVIDYAATLGLSPK